MATKRGFSLPDDGYMDICNGIDVQYNNLNLNQKLQKCLHTFSEPSKSTTFNKRNSFDVAKNDNGKYVSLSWKKKAKDLSPYLKNDYGKKEDGFLKKNTTTNKSTLSLHVAAYEKSVEDSSGLPEAPAPNLIRNHRLKMNKVGLNKQLFVGSIIENPFEFPRQQSDNLQNPELMEFTASQALYSPNQPASSNPRMPLPSTSQTLMPSVTLPQYGLTSQRQQFYGHPGNHALNMSEDVETICNIFGQFDITEDAISSDTSQSSIEDLTKPQPFNDTKAGQLYLLGDWYLNPDPIVNPIWDELEILHKQAMYYSWRSRHREAFKIYKKIFNSFDHKGSHRREIIDAMVHTSLRGKHVEPLEASYYALKNDVETFGDQLNLWSTTVTIAEERGGYLVSALEHLSAIIYLCTLAECGRHWTFFDKIDQSFLPKNCNFRFGAKIRAFFLLKQEYSNFERAADSIEKVTEDLMVKLRKELQETHTEEEIINARNHMCFDIVKIQKSFPNQVEDSQEPPPHACKLDSIVKTSEELDIIRTHFVSKFSFLFEDNQEIAAKLCEPHISEVKEEKSYKWDEISDDDDGEEGGGGEKSEDTLLHSRTFPTRTSPPPKHRSNRTSGFI